MPRLRSERPAAVPDPASPEPGRSHLLIGLGAEGVGRRLTGRAHVPAVQAHELPVATPREACIFMHCINLRVRFANVAAGPDAVHLPAAELVTTGYAHRCPGAEVFACHVSHLLRRSGIAAPLGWPSTWR